MIALKSHVALLSTLPALAALVTVGCGESSPDPVPGSAGTGSADTPGSAGANAGGAALGNGGAVATAGSNAGGSPSAGGSGTAGNDTTGGNPPSAGSSSGGAAGAGGRSNGSGGGASGAAGSTGMAGSGGAATTEKFSFFVTSLVAIRRESGSQNGFGGKLGGLAGADAICTKIAEKSLPNSGAKGWRAFLSTSTINAIDRVGTGPWYDRTGRLVANDIAGLLTERPGADKAIVDDLPNEDGVPNHAGTGSGNDDNHDTITATNLQGKWDGGPTCNDWTIATGSDGPRVGHSWPAFSGMSWMQAHTAPGCEPSVALVQTGAGSGNGIGNGGGYGGFYCFALKP